MKKRKFLFEGHSSASAQVFLVHYLRGVVVVPGIRTTSVVGSDNVVQSGRSRNEWENKKLWNCFYLF